MRCQSSGKKEKILMVPKTRGGAGGGGAGEAICKETGVR